MGKREDLSGQKFHRISVLHESIPKTSPIKYECLCDCGARLTVRGTALKSGNTKSCGCLKSKTTADRNKKHGLSKTPVYFLWKAMKQRCLNPNNKDYHHYGGRGVGICEAWMDFINFYNDMYEAYIKLCRCSLKFCFGDSL